MRLHERQAAQRPIPPILLLGPLLAASTLWLGCASPGAPHPPSLQLPKAPSDFSAARAGDEVQLRFTVPDRTTDNIPLRGGIVRGAVCRQAAAHGACLPVTLPEAAKPLRIHGPHGSQPLVLWTDHLPPALANGPVHAILYRLQLSNAEGRTAGYSAPVAVAAGSPPPPVAAFQAQGTRLGMLLQWTPQPGAGEVLLERQQLDPPPAPAPTGSKPVQPNLPGQKPHGGPAHPGNSDPNGVLWLQADPGNPAAAHTLDGEVTDGTRYRYTAVRRIQTLVGGTSFELRSSTSTPVEITWKDIYPPPTPAGLTAVGFQIPADPAAHAGVSFAVDLIWEPGRDLRVTGYLVRRIALDATGAAQGAPATLTPQPVTVPAFHDTTARPDVAYRYEVVAVDSRGNRSAPAITTLAPSAP